MLKTGSASRGPKVFSGSFPAFMNAHAEAAGKGNVPSAEVDARLKLSLKSETDFFGRSPLDVLSRLATAFHFPPILRAFGARYGEQQGAGSRQRAAENFKAGRTDREASEAPARGPARRALDQEIFRAIPDGERLAVKGKVVGSSPAWGANRRLAALRAISRRFSKPLAWASDIKLMSLDASRNLEVARGGEPPQPYGTRLRTGRGIDTRHEAVRARKESSQFQAVSRPESKNGLASFLDEKRNRLGWETITS